jgi:3-deoxy-manno-octulosonate cytidylyltransferase (CMP-KDO synthetase)
LIAPALINQVADNLEQYPDAAIATLCERLHDVHQVFNPNVVKVVCDARGMAHYFSRSPIPWARDFWPEGAHPDELDLPDNIGYFRHIGIYGYRASVLREFVQWPPAPTERVESLEQLRALYNGALIHVDIADQPPAPGVDTEADLERVRALLAGGNHHG